MVVLEIAVEASALERALAAVVAAGAREVELFDEESPPVIAALFDAREPEEVRARVSSAGISFLRIDVRAGSQVESSDRWCLRPMRFGPLWIVPPGRAVPAGAEAALIIESLGAGVFGSGAHATTALCLERIIELSPIESLLDVGTGSGILALAALALGAERVAGTENDRAAFALAKKNAETNDLLPRFTLARTFEQLEPGENFAEAGRAYRGEVFSVIAANILAGALINLAPDLVRRLASRGTIILSGIRESELEEVARAYRNFGLHRGLTTELDGWYRLELNASW